VGAGGVVARLARAFFGVGSSMVGELNPVSAIVAGHIAIGMNSRKWAGHQNLANPAMIMTRLLPRS
jgi:hypothetical protein